MKFVSQWCWSLHAMKMLFSHCVSRCVLRGDVFYSTWIFLSYSISPLYLEHHRVVYSFVLLFFFYFYFAFLSLCVRFFPLIFWLQRGLFHFCSGETGSVGALGNLWQHFSRDFQGKMPWMTKQMQSRKNLPTPDKNGKQPLKKSQNKNIKSGFVFI